MFKVTRARVMAFAVVLWCSLIIPCAAQCYIRDDYCNLTEACTFEYFRQQVNAKPTDTVLQTRYMRCVAISGQCCHDPCMEMDEAEECSTLGDECLPLPSSYFKAAVCVNRNKLCALYDEGTCRNYNFCTWVGGMCQYKVPTSGSGEITGAPGGTVADQCDAMHPLVLAMLILMFLSLAGAVGFVAYVVQKRQKQADEEEARAEAQEVAAAARRERRTMQ